MKCPKCSSEKTVKNGMARNNQRYKCKECNYQFTKLAYKKEYSKEVKILALQLLYGGISDRKIAKLLGMEKSYSLIRYWDNIDTNYHKIFDNFDSNKILYIDKVCEMMFSLKHRCEEVVKKSQYDSEYYACKQYLQYYYKEFPYA